MTNHSQGWVNALCLVDYTHIPHPESWYTGISVFLLVFFESLSFRSSQIRIDVMFIPAEWEKGERMLKPSMHHSLCRHTDVPALALCGGGVAIGGCGRGRGCGRRNACLPGILACLWSPAQCKILSWLPFGWEAASCSLCGPHPTSRCASERCLGRKTHSVKEAKLNDC